MYSITVVLAEQANYCLAHNLGVGSMHVALVNMLSQTVTCTYILSISKRLRNNVRLTNY